MSSQFDVSVALGDESFVRAFSSPLSLAVWLVDEGLISLSQLGSVHAMTRGLQDCGFFIVHGLGGQQVTVTRNDSQLILF